MKGGNQGLNSSLSLSRIFLETGIKCFREYKALGDATLNRLSGEQLHYQVNEVSNSIAIIVQHMHGNMLSRWTDFLTTDGEKPWRKRDDEFEEHPYSKQQLQQLWNDGWNLVFTALETLSESDLQKTITIRAQPLSVMDAVVRQIAHYSYHVGQMVHIGKEIMGREWESLSIPKKK